MPADGPVPNDADLLKEAVRAGLAHVYTTMPAVVVKYNAAIQTIDAQIVVNSGYIDATGAVVAYTPPVIPNVPVAFPSADGWSITWPLAAGDPVLLLFASRSLDEWKATAGDRHTPRDLRRFNITDAIALPGCRTPSDPIPAEGLDASALVVRGALIKLGSNAATDWVALTTLVDARIAAIVTYINTHTHPTGVGPSGSPAVPLGAQATVASTRVKAL